MQINPKLKFSNLEFRKGVCLIFIFFSRVLAEEGFIFDTKPNGDQRRNFIIDKVPRTPS